MKASRAIALAGGQQQQLMAIFLRGGFKISKQAVSLWAKTDELPARRELQLRRLRPDWFSGGNGVATVKKNPKPRRAPNNLAEGVRRARKARQPKGPPFRPKNYGDPETQL